MLKADLRKQMRDRKRQFTQQQLEELSLPVVARLRPLLRDASVVLAYYALPDEVCIHTLLNGLVAEGKTVLLPRVVDDRTMELCRYSGEADLREGAFHIMEPVGQRFADLSLIDTVLVPGMAFDAQGHRLGRGKGYYDRLLAGLACRKIGVCFDFQKVPEVPVDAHDILMDIVV
jgi:5-formyltetrahydrofolate cyclo-ligase